MTGASMALAEYQRKQSITDEVLASRLGMSVESLVLFYESTEPVSGPMALKLGSVVGLAPAMWVSMSRQFQMPGRPSLAA